MGGVVVAGSEVDESGGVALFACVSEGAGGCVEWFAVGGVVGGACGVAGVVGGVADGSESVGELPGVALAGDAVGVDVVGGFVGDEFG